MILRKQPPNKDQRDEGRGPGGEEGRNRRAAIVLLIAALPVLIGLYVVALYWARPDTYGEQIRFDEFIDMTSAGRIQEAVILDADNRVIGQSDQGPFWTGYGASETAESRVLGALESAGTPTTVRQQWGKGLIYPLTLALPGLLLLDVLVLIFLLMRGRDGLLGFGKSGARRLAQNESKITFHDVAGLDEAIEELAEIRDYLVAPDRFLAMGASVPRGILLTGPPGCGKTLLARAVAGEASVPFFSMSGSDFVEMFVGVGAARIRDLFRTAKSQAPCIIFIDELDAVGRGRVAGAVSGQDERETTLNQLLVEMDGFELSTGVVVLAATNRPDVLDPALLRPGRFDRRVSIDRPDVKGRLGILKIHARGKPLSSSADLEMIAKRTPGFSGADLANVVNEAALLAARRGREEIGQAELNEAVERVVSGPERRTRLLSPRDRRLIAYHEAGHAVVSAGLGTEIVHKISIVSRGHSLGRTWFLPEEDWHVASQSQLEGRLAVLLAGRAAEEILTGERTSGAQDDLDKATQLARRMVAELGMGELGPVSLTPMLGDGALLSAAVASDAISSEVYAEVKELLARARERALRTLHDHREVWETLAQKLQEEESLEGPDLELMLDPVRAPRTTTTVVPPADRSEPPP